MIRDFGVGLFAMLTSERVKGRLTGSRLRRQVHLNQRTSWRKRARAELGRSGSYPITSAAAGTTEAVATYLKNTTKTPAHLL
jgi:REP element-mobilizing transposase RayT